MTMRTALITGIVSLSALLAGPSAWANDTTLRPQQVRPLPGALDTIPMVNDNNPELIQDDGILLSTFQGHHNGAIAVELNGRFDLFSHHVYAGDDEGSLNSTLWLALVAAPAGDAPVELTLLKGSTSLSQATENNQTQAPFLPLPALMAETTEVVASGPGSRVAGDLLAGRTAQELDQRHWTLQPGHPHTVVQLPVPVAGLDPLLNGRNLQLRLHSTGPVSLAMLAAHGSGTTPPTQRQWLDLLKSGVLSTKEHSPTPRGSKGKMIYSRVSGVQIGSSWRATLTDPGRKVLLAPKEPVSWPISSLERGTLGTQQVQTAELSAAYPGTAWAAHGNYGVEYDLTLPIKNGGSTSTTLELSLDSPIKTDAPQGGLRFRETATGPVMFRGPVALRGLDDVQGRPQGRRTVHLVLRQGQRGPALGQLTLEPGEERTVQLRLVYPADATPPQVLTVQPVKQS